MQITSSKPLPSTQELISILKNEFSDQYSYEQFGLGSDKSIIVKKSFFVGVQISRNKNVLSIDGISPSIAASVTRVLMEVLANLFIVFSSLSYKSMEKEIALFLKRKYN